MLPSWKRLFTSSKRERPSELKDNVCGDCAAIDFQRVNRLRLKTLRRASEGILIADLGHRLGATKPKSCCICQFLITAAGDLWRKNLQLRAYSVCRYSSRLNPQFFQSTSKLGHADQAFLAVVDEGRIEFPRYHCDRYGYIFLPTTGSRCKKLVAPQLLPSRVDYQTIRRWLDYCSCHHQRSCRSKPSATSARRLIDCVTREVVPAPPACNYVALSYVWGKKQTQPSIPRVSAGNNAIDLRTIPRVIADAIEVARNMNMRYLWADRYCINQYDAAEKHDQIQRMDAIYHEANFTIIAAAGEDENRGLPGIGSTPRLVQPHARIRGLDILSTMKDPQRAILDSKWNTRAWTFQEAFLSHRRLVFTECQLYFECNLMGCTEALESDLSALYDEGWRQKLPDTDEFPFSPLRTGILTIPDRDGRPTRADMHEHSLKANVECYYGLIEAYSGRKLTYDDDVLNAFVGIGATMQRSKYPLSNLWGLPLVTDELCPRQLGGLNDMQRSVFLESLCWRHDFESPLPSRRKSFPSWSWAGWRGDISMVQFSYLGRHDHQADIRLGWNSDPEEKWIESHRLTKQHRDRQPRLLRITSRAVSQKLMTSRMFLEDVLVHLSVCPRPEDIDNDLSVRDPKQCLLRHVQQGTWFVLLMGTNNIGPWGIVLERGVVFATRVGLVQLSRRLEDRADLRSPLWTKRITVLIR